MKIVKIIEKEVRMTIATEATKENARKVVELLSHGLVRGRGDPVPGQMCVEAAVCYAMGLKHSDEPVCVSRAVRAYKIRLNDSDWSSPAARADGMRRLAIAQLNSSGHVDDVEFSKRVADMTIRKVLPRVLRHAAGLCQHEAPRLALEDVAARCEKEGTAEAARAAGVATRAAEAVKATGAAMWTARAARAARVAGDAWAAATWATWAAEAARAVAGAAEAARTAAKAFETVADQDALLSLAAEEVVQILVSMKSPGAEWLDLAPLEAA